MHIRLRQSVLLVKLVMPDGVGNEMMSISRRLERGYYLLPRGSV